MANRSIVPDILTALERWLDEREAEWLAQSEDDRKPTLPVTKDGKVNVRAVTLALGLKESQEQHLYRHARLFDLINRVAVAQAVKPMKSRADADEDDRLVAERLALSKKDQGELARNLAEREAAIEQLRRRVVELEEQLAIRCETGMTVRAGTVR